MKILVISHDHPHYTAGGTEIMSHDLCSAYREMYGVEATFLAAVTALNRPEMSPGILGRMGPDYLLRTGRYDMFTMARLDGTEWVRSVERVLSEVRPDVVHLHGLDRLGADLVTVIKRIRPQARTVLTLHDYQIICPNEGLLLTRPDKALCHAPTIEGCHSCFGEITIGRHAMRKAHLQSVLGMIDAFVAPSEDLKRRFAAWGLDPARISVVRNGVPQPDEAHLRTLDRRERPRNRFAFFGQFGAHKGLYTLLEAAAQLKTAGRDLRLSLHGRAHHPSANATARFRTALEKASPLAQHVGPYDRSELASLMAQTDWVVLPSLWFENAALTVLEAQRAGRPVICTDLGGLREQVQDGVNGLTVPRQNPAALAETMEMAATEPGLWDRLVRGITPPATTAQIAAQHVALFESLTREVAA